jgi:hypothetical protein
MPATPRSQFRNGRTFRITSSFRTLAGLNLVTGSTWRIETHEGPEGAFEIHEVGGSNESWRVYQAGESELFLDHIEWLDENPWRTGRRFRVVTDADFDGAIYRSGEEYEVDGLYAYRLLNGQRTGDRWVHSEGTIARRLLPHIEWLDENPWRVGRRFRVTTDYYTDSDAEFESGEEYEITGLSDSMMTVTGDFGWDVDREELDTLASHIEWLDDATPHRPPSFALVVGSWCGPAWKFRACSSIQSRLRSWRTRAAVHLHLSER